MLYADAKKWFNEGWVDYFTPQLYWQIKGPQSYPKLLAWWNDENMKHRHLWPGNGAHNVRKSADVAPARNAWPAEELIEQIELTRNEVAEPGRLQGTGARARVALARRRDAGQAGGLGEEE
jgi:uncharacterized lipoprotein YddW (UPF0748 family)